VNIALLDINSLNFVQRVIRKFEQKPCQIMGYAPGAENVVLGISSAAYAIDVTRYYGGVVGSRLP